MAMPSARRGVCALHRAASALALLARPPAAVASRLSASPKPKLQRRTLSVASAASAASAGSRQHTAHHHGGGGGLLLSHSYRCLRLHSLDKNGNRRSFHLSSLIAAPVDAAEALICQLHAATHAPWFVTLPLIALGVNLVFRLPFSVHARRLAQRRAGLAPVLQAWAALHAKAVHQERRQLASSATPPPPPPPPGTVDGEAMKRYRRTASRVYRKFGLQQWKLYGSLAAMPPWLVFIEAIRRLCGAPVGLLGMILRRGGGEEAAAGAAGAAGAASAADAAATATATATKTAATAAAATPATTTDAALSALPALSDPSLTVGGCLWFPDLTAADPYHILPLALSAVMVANVLPATDAGRRALFGLGSQTSSLSPSGSGGTAQVSTEGAIGRGLQRTLLLMSVSVGFVTMHFPSAIHLYWLSSAATSFAITRSLRKAMPLPERDIRPGNKTDFPWIRPPRPAQKKEKHEN